MRDGRLRLFLFGLFFVLLVILVLADYEDIDVETCSGATCSVAGLNSDDTNQDGATIGKGITLTTSWSNTTFASGSIITQVDLVVTHGGDPGISNNLDVTLQSVGGGTTYCSFSYGNTEGDTKEVTDTTSSCSWTKARLDDLEITLYNGDGAEPDNAYISYLEINVTSYIPPDTTKPTIVLNNPGDDTWDLDGDVTFIYTPNDDRNLTNCTLYIDSTLNQTNTSPVNGSQNNFSIIGMSDGNHTWNINCSDASNNTNVSETRTIKIDTTGPVVNLETPLNDNMTRSNDVVFWYNASDAQTTLANCKLIVNDTVKNTHTSPAEDTSLNFTISLINGGWTWWVNCTDSNGFTTKSEERNLTVNGTQPVIAPDKGSYILSEIVMLTGENFNPTVGITINYTLANGTVITKTNTTTALGMFNSYLPLPYAYPNGTYTVFAYETSDITQNASTSFTVNLPPTSITATPSPFRQGDEPNISGTDFSPSTTVNITLSFTDASTDSFLASTDANGDFTAFYNLSYTQALGVTNVIVFDVTYPKLNDTANFTILQRVALVTTDAGTYGRDESVNIYGYNFTRQNLTELRIYDNNTDDLGSGFPLNKTADDTGYWAHGWNTNDWCNGIYRVEALDQSNAFLNDTAYFTIEELITNQEFVTITSGAKYHTTRLSVAVSNVNVSDGTDESLTSNSKTTWYYEFNFTNAYNLGLQIDHVDFLIEHADTGGFSNPALQYWNGSQYVGVSCPALTTGGTDHNDSCDVTSLFTSPADLDAVSFRVTLLKTGGGSDTWTVDYTHLNISTSYEPSCTYFNGSQGGGLAANPPFISNVLLDDNVLSPPDELDLNAGTTKTMMCNVTVSDGDGYTDIQGVNATLYSETVLVSDPDDDLNHYTNTSCTLATGSGNVANYTCDFQVWYYAINGTWLCEATATDGTDTSTNDVNSTMNFLYALNVTPTLIDYGDVGEGAVAAEQTGNVSNIGNTPLNLSLMGYGVTYGDDLSFNCSGATIPVAQERYGFSSGLFSSKTSLAGSMTPALLTVQPTTDGTPSFNMTYWQVQVPILGGIRSVCNGTIVFQADAP